MAKAELITEIDEQGFKFVIAELHKGKYQPIQRSGKLVFRDLSEAEDRFNELLEERRQEDAAKPFTVEEAREFVRKYAKYRKFAKTFANTCPHSYYVRDHFIGEEVEDYNRFIATYKANMQEGWFYSRKFRFFILDDEYFFPLGYDNLVLDILNVNSLVNLEVRNGVYYYKRQD